MFDSPVPPVHRIYAIEPLAPVAIRRRPGRGQLRAWLRFAKTCAARKSDTPAEADPAPRLHHDEGRHSLDIDA